MKLQEFVSETLKEIIAGVKEAQKYAASESTLVNPELLATGGTKSGTYQTAYMGQPPAYVEFDVAVTSTEGSATEAGAGIFVAGFGLGAKGKSDESSSSLSRIKFSVPVGLPIQRPQKSAAQNTTKHE